MDLDSAIKELHSLSSSPKKTVRFAPDVEQFFTLTPTHWKDGVRETDLQVRHFNDKQVENRLGCHLVKNIGQAMKLIRKKVRKKRG